MESDDGRLGIFDRATRGLVAGAIGGLIGAGTKLLGELAFPPRFPGEPIPPAVAVSKFLTWMSGHPLLPDKELLAVQAFHWSFSVIVGAAYGVAAEFLPIVCIGYGAGFGLFVLLLTHESTLPLLGLSLPWSQIPLKEHLSEVLTHILYGVTTELIRRLARSRFSASPSHVSLAQ